MTSTTKKLFTRRILPAAFAVIATAGHLLRHVLGFFAESAETAPDKTNADTIRGGVMNYRTGKLDDGTDASGWYEKD